MPEVLAWVHLCRYAIGGRGKYCLDLFRPFFRPVGGNYMRRLAANLTGNQAAPVVRGAIPGAPLEAKLLLNVRAHLDPGSLRTLVERALASTAGGRFRYTIDKMAAFSPARPQPRHRYGTVA